MKEPARPNKLGIVNTVAFKMPGTRKIGERYTGGLDLETALEKVRALNHSGIHASLNYLGEHKTDTDEIIQVVNEYKKIIDSVHERNHQASISLKPTLFGQDNSEEQSFAFLSELTHHAKTKNVFVWIDMEGSNYTDSTLNIYKRLADQNDNVGVVLQANLKRTLADMKNLSQELGKRNTRLRLCKGAYIEPPQTAHQTAREIDENYRELITSAFRHAAHIAVASHDEPFLHLAASESRKHPEVHLEFQMLRGIHPKLERKFADLGHHVTQYIPYGPESFGTLIRRLLKGRGTLSLVARTFFRKHSPKDRK